MSSFSVKRSDRKIYNDFGGEYELKSDCHEINFSNSYLELEYVDYYKEERDSFLKTIFPDFPEHLLYAFDLSFSISNTAKNGFLVYSVLERIPHGIYTTDKNNIRIIINDEKTLVEYLSEISDVLIIVRHWKSTKLIVNGISVGTTTEYGYLVNYLIEKNNQRVFHFSRSTEEIKKKYNRRKRSSKRTVVAESRIKISRNDIEIVKCPPMSRQKNQEL